MLRTCVLCCAMLGVLGLVVGCKNSTEPTKPAVKKEDAIKGYNSQLVDFDKQIAELKTKAEKATGDEKTKLEAKLKTATEKRDAAKKKLEELEKAATDKVEAINKEVQSAFDELKKAVSE